MSNIHGLFSNRRRDSSSDDDDDGGQHDDENSRYVGGIDARGGGSGLAVEPNPEHSSSSGARDSVFNLATTESSPDVDGPSSSSSSSGSGGGRRRTITMYRNGFTVDDGPYRRLDDPANAEFLTSLARGLTPRELMTNADGSVGRNDITVGLVDKRGEDYNESAAAAAAPAFESFSGTGTSLGSAQPSSRDASGIITPSSSSSTAEKPEVDESKPTTSIQVRLINGKRIVIKINLTSTILTLGQAIDATGEAGTDPYVLTSGFPPKPLVDLNQTIEQAGLKGAQVIQKKAWGRNGDSLCV